MKTKSKKPPADPMGYHYDSSTGTPKLIITDIKKTQNLPPPPRDFEGIRIENGKPVFHASAVTKQAVKSYYAKSPKDRTTPEPDAPSPKPKDTGFPRAWDSNTPEEKEWYKRVTGKDPDREDMTDVPRGDAPKLKTTRVIVTGTTEVAVRATEGEGGGRRYSVYEIGRAHV